MPRRVARAVQHLEFLLADPHRLAFGKPAVWDHRAGVLQAVFGRLLGQAFQQEAVALIRADHRGAGDVAQLVGAARVVHVAMG